MTSRSSFLRPARLASLPLLLALPVACTTGGSGAAGQSAPSASASAQVAASAQPSASAAASANVPPKPDRHGQGPAGMMFREARALELSDAQKTTLDGLEAARENGDAPSDDYKDLQSDVVAGIRAGKLDKARLQGDFAAIDKATAERQAKEEVALSGLYAALTPPQRSAVVAAVRAKQAARDAHQEAHADLDAGAAEFSKRRLARITEQLRLDPGQQKAVEAILAKTDSGSPGAMHAVSEEGKKRTDAVLAAFDGTSFDPKKLDLTGSPGKTPHEGLEKDTAFLAQLLPLLTPEQREKLAAQREHSGLHRRGEGRNGRGGEPGAPWAGGGAGGPGGDQGAGGGPAKTAD